MIKIKELKKFTKYRMIVLLIYEDDNGNNHRIQKESGKRNNRMVPLFFVGVWFYLILPLYSL